MTIDQLQFDEIESAVVRFLRDKYIENPSQRPARVCPQLDDIAKRFGLTKEQCYLIAARFEAIGIVEWVAKQAQGEFLRVKPLVMQVADKNQSTTIDQRKEAQMDVLISWSKKQSKEMASAFHSWLPKVVPGCKPWMSSKDIDKGKQWFGELQQFLGEANSCIICVTSENVRSPWVYYETGAISTKKSENVLVCPYLVGIGTSMISDGPLSQWQCTEATKAETLALIKSLNKALAKPNDEGLLCGNFENKWPEFEQELKRILDMEPTAASAFVETEADKLAGFKLSAEERTLLVAAAKSKDGKVLSVGGAVMVTDVVLNDQASPRSRAIWKQALKDLVDNGLMEMHGYKPTPWQTGEVFDLTGKGYKVADALGDKDSGLA